MGTCPGKGTLHEPLVISLTDQGCPVDHSWGNGIVLV